jgi:hypothetical protein
MCRAFFKAGINAVDVLQFAAPSVDLYRMEDFHVNIVSSAISSVRHAK